MPYNRRKDNLSGSGFVNEYYEQLWSQTSLFISPADEQRIGETIFLIPRDCSSILDVGCGDGRIINRLASQYRRIVGLERSSTALQYVETMKALGSIERLPFPDRSFDLILCCEVLEHLPFDVYHKAIAEMERVAARYIIVTVPNNEDLRRSSIACTHCGFIFHAERHVRSFNHEILKGLFNRFSLRTIQTCFPMKFYPLLLLKIARMMKILPLPTAALCPQCGSSPLYGRKSLPKDHPTNRNSVLFRRLRLLAASLMPIKKTGRWLMALYVQR